jgi:hypothetical protein
MAENEYNRPLVAGVSAATSGCRIPITTRANCRCHEIEHLLTTISVDPGYPLLSAISLNRANPAHPLLEHERLPNQCLTRHLPKIATGNRLANVATAGGAYPSSPVHAGH